VLRAGERQQLAHWNEAVALGHQFGDQHANGVDRLRAVAVAVVEQQSAAGANRVVGLREDLVGARLLQSRVSRFTAPMLR
jgi:hypothetical protein